MARHTSAWRRRLGFTLVELMVVIALAAIVLALAAPSFTDYIKLQRLKGVHAQVVTDIQFARSEAVSRGVPVQVWFRPASGSDPSCYIIFTSAEAVPEQKCDCRRPEGARCNDPAKSFEIRTVEIPTSQGVHVNTVASQAEDFAFDPRTGGIKIATGDFATPTPNQFSVDTYLSSTLSLRDTVGLSGRVSVCVPPGSTLQGTAC